MDLPQWTTDLETVTVKESGDIENEGFGVLCVIDNIRASPGE